MYKKALNIMQGKSLKLSLVWQACFSLLSVRLGLCFTASRTIKSIQKVLVKESPIVLVGRRRQTSFTASEISNAIRAASRYIPKASCLTQALAGKYLLAQHGHTSQLKIGVTNPQDFKAHAWLEHKNQVVLGEVSNLADYTALKGA